MKKSFIAALVLGTAFAVVPATSAQAQAEGILCGFTSVTDPTTEGDVQVGELDGGPLTATDTGAVPPTANPSARMTLTCTIQVGANGATYAGANAASASADGTGVVVLPPTLIDYVAPPDTAVYICTSVTVDGKVYNFDYQARAWVETDAAACSEAISQEVPTPDGLLACVEAFETDQDPVAFADCVAEAVQACLDAFVVTPDPVLLLACLGVGL